MATETILNNASRRMWQTVEDVQLAIENMWIEFTLEQPKQGIRWGMEACGILNDRWGSVYCEFFI